MTAAQLEPFEPEPPKPAPDDWGVLVDECAIFSAGSCRIAGIDKAWQQGRWQLEFQGRVTILGLTPAGGLYHISCKNRDAALEMAEVLLELGVPKRAVAAKRLSQCGRTGIPA